MSNPSEVLSNYVAGTWGRLNADRHAEQMIDRLRENGWLIVKARPVDPLAPTAGLTNTHAPETAHLAAAQRNHRVTWANDRGRILRLFGSYGRHTAADLAGLLGAEGRKLSRNQVASRLLELRQLGLVKYSRDGEGKPILRETGPNAKGRVQEATYEGVMWVRTNRPGSVAGG